MRKVSIWFVILLFISGVQSQVNPELLDVSVFSVEDGLSQSSVQAIGQDVFGFLWISTGDGLNCFDGRSFRHYYSESLIYNQEQSNSIRNIVSDSIGNLWVGTDRGLMYFDRSENILVIPFPSIRELIGRACLPLFCTTDSISVLAVDQGILTIHKQNHQFQKKQQTRKLTGLNILGESKEEKWLGFDPGIATCFTNDALSGIHFQEFSFDIPTGERLESIAGLGEGKYLCAARHSLFLFSKNDRSIEKIDTDSWPLNAENIMFKNLAIGPDNKIWVTTSNHGIGILNRDYTVFSWYHLFRIYPHQVSGFENITRLFPDRQGSMWIGTDGSGIAHYKNKDRMLGRVSSFTDEGGKEITPFVKCFYEDPDQNIWFGTNQNGLIKWNRKKHSFEKWLFDHQSVYPSANSVYCIMPLNRTRLFIGTTLGLYQFDLSTRQHQKMELIQSEYSVNKVSDIVRMDDSTFTLLMNESIYTLLFRNDAWTFVPAAFPDTIAYKSILLDKFYGLIAFSANGLYRIRNQSFTGYPFMHNGRPVYIEVNAAITDTSMNLWLATDKGLVAIDSTAVIRAFYHEKEGLPSHYLYGLLIDEAGNIWISSNGGISKFERGNQEFINYSMKDGLQSLEFNSGAFYKTGRGEFYFGGISGFNFFFPHALKTESYLTKVVIRAIRVNDLPYVSDTSMMAKKSLEFSFQQNTLGFEYVSPDFKNGENVRYSYILEGHDQDWIDAGTNNQVRYSKLRPGKYTFRVKVKNSAVNLTSTMAEIRIFIRKPFWMTNSFIAALFILSLVIVVAVVRYFSTIRIKKRIAQLEHEQEINAIRRRISADLHDDVGSGLSKLAMMSDKAMLIAGNGTDMMNYISRISGEARQMIDQLRIIVWTLNPLEDKLDGLIAYVNHHISDYLEDFPVRFKVFIPDTIPAIPVTPEFKRNLYYAIREAVHNAMKHSGADKLSIDIKLIGSRLKIIIEDNGIGLDLNSSIKFGNGIQLMRRRIEDLGGAVTISGKKGFGTIIEYDIPI